MTKKTFHKKYIIYRKGKVYSKLSGTYIGRINRNGDPIVDLKQNGAVVTRYVKHLVAEMFVDNPDPQSLTEVININHKRTDCRAINLRWTDRAGSFAHARNKPHPNRSGNKKPKSDDFRLDRSQTNYKVARSTPQTSSTFIQDQNHAESLFLP